MPGQAEQVNDQDDPEYDQAPNASTRGAAEDQRRPEGNQPDPGGGKGTRASAQAGARALGAALRQPRGNGRAQVGSRGSASEGQSQQQRALHGGRAGAAGR